MTKRLLCACFALVSMIGSASEAFSFPRVLRRSQPCVHRASIRCGPVYSPIICSSQNTASVPAAAGRRPAPALVINETPEEEAWLREMTEGRSPADRQTIEENWAPLSRQARKEAYENWKSQSHRTVVEQTDEEKSWLGEIVEGMTAENVTETQNTWKFLSHGERKDSYQKFRIASQPVVEMTGEEKGWLVEMLKGKSAEEREDMELAWSRASHEQRKEIYDSTRQ